MLAKRDAVKYGTAPAPVVIEEVVAAAAKPEPVRTPEIFAPVPKALRESAELPL